MSRKIAVIGSNSFSGSDFVDLLLEDAQNEVIGISRSPEKTEVFLPYKRHAQPRFTFYQLNLNQDLKRICAVLDEFKPEATLMPHPSNRTPSTRVRGFLSLFASM